MCQRAGRSGETYSNRGNSPSREEKTAHLPRSHQEEFEACGPALLERRLAELRRTGRSEDSRRTSDVVDRIRDGPVANGESSPTAPGADQQRHARASERRPTRCVFLPCLVLPLVERDCCRSALIGGMRPKRSAGGDSERHSRINVRARQSQHHGVNPISSSLAGRHARCALQDADSHCGKPEPDHSADVARSRLSTRSWRTSRVRQSQAPNGLPSS